MRLATRADGPELMDADDLDAATYAKVVHDLARVNTVTLAARPTLGFLAGLPDTSGSLRILDVGFGDGDMLRRIERWSHRRGIKTRLTGVDLNPRSAPAALAKAPAGSTIRWLTGDYAGLADEPWDVVISSLVAHHMTRGELVSFVRFMEQHARAGWFVNDLHRHQLAYHGFPLLARLMRAHPIVKHDGKLSIARSYRHADWISLLGEAQVSNAHVFRAFPFRLCVERRR